MGLALLGAATLMLMTALQLFPAGGDTLGLTGAKLGIGLAGNFALGALMMLGIGLYAPCMILVYLLGMTPDAAFPIMMGSCAFLMPISSVKFVKTRTYHVQAALGLAIGGLPAALIAALIVEVAAARGGPLARGRGRRLHRAEHADDGQPGGSGGTPGDGRTRPGGRRKATLNA